jgi:2-iminobutanoate/2-iminopropanoate deaminase
MRNDSSMPSQVSDAWTAASGLKPKVAATRLGASRALALLVSGLAFALTACATAPVVVATDKAPKAIGPYSQAVRAGATLYLSGQIPLDPGTGEIVQGGIEAQARRVLDNLKAVLAAAGYRLEDVVSCQVFLLDLGDFAAVNKIYGEYFPTAPPARATVQVAGLPRGARIEITAIAVKP